MQRATRRGVLATMGLAATAGCSSALGDRLDLGGGSTQFDSFREETVADVAKTVTIPSGKFWAHEFSFDTQTVLLYSVVASDHVDVIMFRRSAFETYREDVSSDDSTANQLQHVGELSELATRATSKGSAVTSGDPVLVVDNTTWARAPPSEDVEVEVDIDAFVRKTQSQSTGNEGQNNQVNGSNESS